MDKDNPHQIYGLIGYPVKHSLSPLMHNAAFKALGINAEYKLFEIKPEELENFWVSLKKSNIFGLNVTIPYKEYAIDFVELTGEESYYLRLIGAVNTMVRKGDNTWLGFNTDIYGFEADLSAKFNLLDKKVAVLGAGGAARAVVYVLAKTKVAEMAIFDIDKRKAESVGSLGKTLSPNLKITVADNIEALDLKDKNLLVNCTPLGMKESDPLPIREEMLHKGLFVYDLIYNPTKTKLLVLAEKIGAKTSNGLGMLLCQGARSFTYFTGKDAPIEIMRNALNEGVKKL